MISLGKTLKLLPVEPVKFDKSSTPPRVTAEFQIDAGSLARAKGIDLTIDQYRGIKWEINETKKTEGKDGDEIRFVARIPKHKLEIYEHPFHSSDKVNMQVIRKPVQVLLFASAATREYQLRAQPADPRDGEGTRPGQHPPADPARRHRAARRHRSGRAGQPAAAHLPRQVRRTGRDRGREAARPVQLRRHHRLRPRLDRCWTRRCCRRCRRGATAAAA